jgi:DNA-binding winged helix-turn-helix (wHTH) protein
MPEQHLKPVYTYRGWEFDLSRRELRLFGAPVPIGARAFEIIEVLVQAAGQTVNKYDLIDGVWPGAGVGAARLAAIPVSESLTSRGVQSLL